jgi:hypothetical protein
MWGDFNCAIGPRDVRGHYSRSNALEELIKRFSLRETWTQDAARPLFTYYHTSGDSTIDRFYLTQDLCAQKTRMQILPVAFTDHCAVELRLCIPEYREIKRHRRWTLNPSIAKDVHIRRKLREEWKNWRKRKRYYWNVTQWWERCVKKRLRIFISKEMAERNADYCHIENRIYSCMYEVLNSDETHEEKPRKLNGFKAKIMRLHANRTDQIIWIRLDMTH